MPKAAQHLIHQFDIELVGKVEVSTINLSESTMGIAKGYETCIFWPGGSEVAERYRSWEEAKESHDTWTATRAALFVSSVYIEEAITRMEIGQEIARKAMGRN